MATISAILKKDPLDFRAANENYLISKRIDTLNSEKLLTELNRKMRNFDQNYLELAVGYVNDGYPEEAEDILKRYDGKNQEISYWLGYLQEKKGNKTGAEKFFKEGSDQSVDYGFPYRLETEKVLIIASKYNPEDAKPYYYLGNLLYDKQPQRAIEYWEKAVKLEPKLAIAWRNLGWGYYQSSHDLSRAINAYEKALDVKKDDPVYYAELDPLYEINNTPIEKRARLFESKNDIVKQRDDAFVREIIVLNLSGQSEKAVEYLAGSNFHFREGSSRVRDITVDAHILLGKKYLENKKYDLAMQQFFATVATPENSRAKSNIGDMRSPQINYYIGLANEALGKKAEAKSSFILSSDQTIRDNNYIHYYQGLSLLKLGNKEKAAEYFNALITEGDKQIKQGSEVDFFAKFGERESENARLSNAYLLKGLGYKGLGDKTAANENLKKAVNLSASNLYAKVEME
jgi:tetratricopeptide (TPR) repeat protein